VANSCRADFDFVAHTLKNLPGHNFTLGSPTALSAQGTRESFFGGLLFGAYSLLVLIFAGFTFWTRHWVYATYTKRAFSCKWQTPQRPCARFFYNHWDSLKRCARETSPQDPDVTRRHPLSAGCPCGRHTLKTPTLSIQLTETQTNPNLSDSTALADTPPEWARRLRWGIVLVGRHRSGETSRVRNHTPSADGSPQR